MSTAIADQATTATFISKDPELVLTRRPARYIQDGEGDKILLGESEWLARQEDLNYQRQQRGEDPLEIDRTPWKVRFNNHTLRVPDDVVAPGSELPEDAAARLIDWLRTHQRLNTPGPCGFYEQGKAPDEPRPTLTEQMKEIADAGAAGDETRVEAALQLERETHNREAVIVAAETGLTRLRQLAESAFTAGYGDPGESGQSHGTP